MVRAATRTIRQSDSIRPAISEDIGMADDESSTRGRGDVSNPPYALLLGNRDLSFSIREAWTVLHGMGLGAMFLLAYSGGWIGLAGLRRDRLTEAGLQARMRPLRVWLWIMALVSWSTVLSGTLRVYPWYRGTPPPGLPPITPDPKSVLLANPRTAGWHHFGMEWKEHVAWIAPIASTAVAGAVTQYGADLADRPQERHALLAWYHVAFLAAAVAGAFGAFVNKAASFRNEGSTNGA
jgi:hypothetical protein